MSAAASGIVRGTVVAAETLIPVFGAHVSLDDSALGAVTNSRGEYRLEGVPSGPRIVKVRLAGYVDASRTLPVEAGAAGRLDFELVQTALRLHDRVEAGLAGAAPRINVPLAITRLSVADLPVPSSDVASLLAGKAAGVSVISASGQPGEAASILIRGTTSIDASGRHVAPLVVIDGVILSEEATLAEISTLDVAHVDIARGAAATALYGARGQNGVILISTKRGHGIPDGTTRVMGRAGWGRSVLVGEIGLVRAHPYLMNEAGTSFVDEDGNEVGFWDTWLPAANQIHPGEPATSETVFYNQEFPFDLFDHMDTVFDPGQTLDLHGALTGRFGESAYRASLDVLAEQGIVHCTACVPNLERLNRDRVQQGFAPYGADRFDRDGYDRYGARINVDSRAGDLQIAASGFYSRSNQDDKAVARGFFRNLPLVSPAVDLTRINPRTGVPYLHAHPREDTSNPLRSLAGNESREERTRAMGAADLEYAPGGSDWLTLGAGASFDRTEILERRFFHPVNRIFDNYYFAGGLQQGTRTSQATHAHIGLRVARTFMGGDMRLRARARYLREEQDFKSLEAIGPGFSLPDVPSFDAIAGDPSVGSEGRRIKGRAFLAAADLAYRGRYLLDGIVRRDGASLFGPEARWHTYFRGAAAWRVSREAFWNVDFIDELKLRFALGTAGGRPNFHAQYETYGNTPAPYGRVRWSTRLNLANRRLRPEFTREAEAGLDLVVGDKLALDLTYAWRTTDDQLLRVPQPAFLVFPWQWRNAGEVESRTWEATIRYAPIETRDESVGFRLTWDRTRQVVSRLDVPAFRHGPFFVSEGRSVGEVWGTAFATDCADLAPVGVTDCGSFQVNDDGLLVATGPGNDFTEGFARRLWGTEVAVTDAMGDTLTYRWGLPIAVRDRSPACIARDPGKREDCPLTGFLPLGNTTPDFNASFATNLRYKSLTFSGLLEASVGHSIYNRMARPDPTWLRGPDLDQSGKSPGHQKPLAYVSTLGTGERNSWLLEDGDWLKVREMSVSYTLPEDLIQSLFGGAFRRVTLTAAGSNLFTFTGYRGYDPEVGISGGVHGSPQVNAVDSYAYPNFRTFTYSAEIVF
ncbi:SusC/RagA family TonB-linked outer membrane protein [Candidatus Palauibacter sp.]|uniref:SusC/RagA family TonB-linked outer membrane protein n=1 Tax=Candidatus Palauibacter sp. TaxID=3101350 RepID=UPI003B52C9EF